MKRNITLICAFILSSTFSWGQYMETFSTTNKGILMGGSCGTTLATCTITDFTGETWTLGGDLSGVDTEGFLTTANPNNSNNTALYCEDGDTEVCWLSPVLTGNSGAGTSFSISVDINLDGYDAADYLDIEYQTDGMTWVQVPNANGTGAANTIGFTSSANDFDQNVSVGPFISATDAIQVRICFDHNSAAEDTYLDNIMVTNASNVLPVDLISFDAIPENDQVVLDWVTASELNNRHFELQRSSDGVDFKTISEIAGNGTIQTFSNYDYIDKTPRTGINYYRLKQVDFDGKYEFSEIVSAKILVGKGVQVTPNPFDGTIVLNFEDKQLISSTQRSITISDVTGQVVRRVQIDASQTSTTLDLSALSSGAYILRTQVGTQEVVAQRIVKL